MKIVCIQISDAQIHCLVTGTGHFLIIFCIQMHKFTVWSREPVISSLFSVFRCTSALSGHGNRSFLHYFLYSDAQVHCLITGTGHFFIIFCIQMHQCTVRSREPVISSLYSVFRCTSSLSGHGEPVISSLFSPGTTQLGVQEILETFIINFEKSTF